MTKEQMAEILFGKQEEPTEVSDTCGCVKCATLRKLQTVHTDAEKKYLTHMAEGFGKVLDLLDCIANITRAPGESAVTQLAILAQNLDYPVIASAIAKLVKFSESIREMEPGLKQELDDKSAALNK